MGKFPQRLKKALARADNVTHKHIADLVGISRASVTHWLRGKNSPNPDQLAIIAKELKVSVDYLCGLDQETWIYELPQRLVEFVKEEALSDPVYLELATYIKKSGVSPETVKSIVKVLERELANKADS